MRVVVLFQESNLKRYDRMSKHTVNTPIYISFTHVTVGTVC